MECPVCFDTIAESAPQYAMSCGHCFHVECIVRWAQSDNDMHGSCPVCRFQESQERGEFTQLNVDYGSRGHAQWARISKALESAVSQMDDAERMLYETLRKDEERANSAARKAREAHKGFIREHGTVIKRGRALQRRLWSNRFNVTRARRNLVSMFPVTHIMIRQTDRGERSVGMLRRSSRLAERDQNATEPTH